MWSQATKLADTFYFCGTHYGTFCEKKSKQSFNKYVLSGQHNMGRKRNLRLRTMDFEKH